MHADTARRRNADDWSVSNGVPPRAAPTRSPTWRGKVRAKGATPAGASDTGANGDSSDSAKVTQDLGILDRNCSESSAWPHTPPAASSPPHRTPPLDSESGTWSAWGLSPREWGEVQSGLRAETPSASQESGQQTSAARRSRGPDEGCGTQASPPARADIRSASARAGEPPGRAPRRRGDRWSPQCGRESAPRSPGPAAPPPQTCSRRDRGQDPAGGHSRLALRHSTGPAVPRNQPNSDAGGSARGDPIPSDAQATPSPASPEIAAESVAQGIALGVSAGLPDHEGMGGEESVDAQGSADPPPCTDNVRDAREKGGAEKAAEEADVEASARAPAAADRLGGPTQHVQAPTNTPASLADGSITPDRTAADASAPTKRGRGGHGAWEPQKEEERGESAWDAAAAAADDEGTGEDEEVEERAAQIGAAPVQAVTRELRKG
ncbi:unnamed protein product [Closterium sp. Yama58-4]|nr:unnamed protein product [Closterium sp. Yama58-4]